MDIMLSVLASEIVSRLISSVIAKYHRRSTKDKRARLEQVLIRAHTLIEEAEGRDISHQGMLLQLRRLSKDMYRGYYVLDTFKGRTVVSQPFNLNKIQIACESLETSFDDMKEFAVFLMDCPRIFRQPYSTYLFMERCMFGRHAEKDHIIKFLLQPFNSSLSVLPIIGPPEIGKRTLVEHVWMEERVRQQFSQIVRINSGDLNHLATDGVINNREFVSNARSLIVVELGHNFDDATWRRLHSLICHKTSYNSKVILISTMEEVSSWGTTRALKLKKLHRDEFWYYFKTIAFGSENPDDHQALLPIARNLLTYIDGCFIGANIFGRLLQANLSANFWRYVLEIAKKAAQLHFLKFGEHSRDRISKGRLFYLSNHIDCPPLLCYQLYKTDGCLMKSELPRLRSADLITGVSTIPSEGNFDVLRWQSTILPYHSYMASCVGQNAQQVVPKEKLQKRKRRL